MKKFLQEFKEFALKGNVLELAVGIIIGAAFKDIVNSVTGNFLRPILRFITSFGKIHYNWYDISGFLTNIIISVVNFIIMALVLFLIIKGVKYLHEMNKKDTAESLPTTKTCPFCKSKIDILATRCPHCTSEQPAEKEN